MLLQDYKFDVFLSWTGADKNLKNRIKEILTDNGMSCYDSEIECKGEFRSDYIAALQKSKLYLLIMTDNLKNNPNVSGYGSLTEVRREVNLAMDLEASGDLNVLIFNTSEFFCYKKVFRDMSDKVGWFFYTNTRGFSRIDALYGLDEASENKLVRDVLEFVNARNANNPILSQRPNLGIENLQISDCDDFTGREGEIEEIHQALASGSRAVILSGMGGMGKTTIARHFLADCKEKGIFLCPQVIRIQNSDNASFSDIFGTVLSSIVFSDAECYRGLSDSEKRQKQEKVLAELPDFVILAVDNLSALSEEELNVLLQKTKCRLLLTTRKPLESFDKEKVKQIHVDKLDISVARQFFDKISGGKVDENRFKVFFEDIIGGHTITLRMIATAMRIHKKSLDDMLDEVESSGCWSEDITYKDTSDNVHKNSVSGILEGLFNISGFENDENCIAILRTLSLIAQGKMRESELSELLNLKNRNEILKLAEYNWISIEDEYISLHPVLSQIVNKVLKPTSENSHPAVRYLAEQSQNRKDLTYNSLVFVRDGLFFAIKRLAGNDGTLNLELWSEYAEICRLINDTDTVVSNSAVLSEKLHSPRDKTKVDLFATTTKIETQPSKIEDLLPYFEKIDLADSDYKFVLQTLSVVIPFVSADSIQKLEELLDKTLDMAIAKEDSFAIIFCLAYVLNFNLSVNLIKKVKNYVKKHKNDKSGSILYIRILLSGYSMLKEDYVKTSVSFISGQTSLNEIVKKIMFNIKEVLRSYRLAKKGEKISENDDLYDYFQYQLKLIQSYVDNDTISPTLFYKAVSSLHNLALKNNISFLNSFDIMKNTLAIVKAMPKSWQGELQQIASAKIFDSRNFTIGEYLDYQLDYEINLLLGDKYSLAQAEEMLEVEKSLFHDSHENVINAHIRLASCLSAFGEGEKALEEYSQALRILEERGEKSKKIFEVCNSMLSIYVCQKVNIDEAYVEKIYKLGAENVKPFSDDALVFNINYINVLKNFASLNENKDFLSETYDEIIGKNILKYVQNVKTNVITYILDILYNLCLHFINKSKIKLADNLLDRIRKLKGFASNKLELQRIEFTLLWLKARYNYQIGKFEESNHLFDLALDFGCRNKINFKNLTSCAILWKFALAQNNKEVCEFLQREKDNDYYNCILNLPETINIYAINLFIKTFFGKTRLTKKQRKLVENVFSVISVNDGCVWGNERDKLSLLLKFGNQFARENYTDNFGLKSQQWRKIKNGKQYKLAVLDILWGEFSKTYDLAPWKIEYRHFNANTYAQYFVHGSIQLFDKYMPTGKENTSFALFRFTYIKKKIDQGFETPKEYLESFFDFISISNKGFFQQIEQYRNCLLSDFKSFVSYMDEDTREEILDIVQYQIENELNPLKRDDWRAVDSTLLTWMEDLPYIAD